MRNLFGQNRVRSRLMRVDPEFNKIVNQVLANNIMRGKRVRTSRVTLAIKRQYEKHPNLFRELMEADLP